MEQGEYGICKRCGQPIAPERLLALPEARLCVRCKSAEEKTRRHRVRYRTTRCRLVAGNAGLRRSEVIL